MEKEIGQINSSIEKIASQLNSYAEDVSKGKALNDETKNKVDKLLSEQTVFSDQLKKMEQTIVGLDGNVLSSKEKQTLGKFIASQESLKSYNGKGRISFDVNAAAIADAVTTKDKNGANMVRPHFLDGIYGVVQHELKIRDLLGYGITTSNSIQYTKETSFTNNAAGVDENPANPKPKSKLEFEEAIAPIDTIAHWIPVSKQVLEDLSQIESYINGRLAYGLDAKEEAMLLKGTGGGARIHGIFAQAKAYVAKAATGTNKTQIDIIRDAMLQSFLNGGMISDAIVLDPTTWATIEMLKDTSGQYIFANPQGVAVPGLWGKPVVQSLGLDAGEFLVGNFKNNATYWDRQQTTITISDSHDDFFVRNMLALLAEKRAGLTVYMPDAFIKGDFATALA